MSTIEEHSLALIGRERITDASPCGENARYEPDFEELEAELAKQESLTSATVDWSKIVDLASLIINRKSKDILVGSYLCYGLLLKEGYLGLAVGLKILCDMSEQHWDCLFPPAKRMRARQTAFVWLSEKAGLVISDKAPAPHEAALVIEAMEYLKQLDTLLGQQMGDQAPVFSDLSRPLKGYAQSAIAEKEKSQPATTETTPAEPVKETPQPAAQQTPANEQVAAPAKPAAPPPPSATGVTDSAPPVVTSGPIEKENDCKKTLRQVQAAIREVSGFWLAQKLSDPRTFRINRVAAWIVVENIPPANDGITQINPPPSERLKFFHSKMDGSEYLEVLPELEKTLSRAPFWLDGQFLVAQVLKALGAEFEKALQSVIDETAGFLKRLPGLTELSFSDQSPFASDQTRLWLENEVMTAALADSKDDSSPETSAGDWDSALLQANQLAAGGDTNGALKLMNTGIKAAGAPRSQMYWRCALSKLLLQTGQAYSASQILEQIAMQLEKNKINLYEPALLAQTYTLLYQSYQKQLKKNKDDTDLKEKSNSAYAKLCWFDPVTALSV